MESAISTKAPISMLLAEDEDATLGILANMLTKKFPGFPLHTADNGRTALELFKIHLPQIVITDLNMPEMNGIQMAAKIRSINPGTKFIILTGNSGKVNLEACSGEDFETKHYIMKPVRFGLLFAAIEQCLGEIELQGSGPVHPGEQKNSGGGYLA